MKRTGSQQFEAPVAVGFLEARFVDLVGEGEVLQVEDVGALVDAEGGDAIPAPVPEAVGDDPLHGASDVVSGSAEVDGGLLPADEPGPGGEEMAVGVAAGALALGPRDVLDFDAAAGGVAVGHAVGEKDGNVEEWSEIEEPRPGVRS